MLSPTKEMLLKIKYGDMPYGVYDDILYIIEELGEPDDITFQGNDKIKFKMHYGKYAIERYYTGYSHSRTLKFMSIYETIEDFKICQLQQ